MVPSSSLKVHYGDEPFISHAVLTELCKMVNARFETERHTWGPSLASRIWSNSLTYSTLPSIVSQEKVSYEGFRNNLYIYTLKLIPRAKQQDFSLEVS